MQVLVHDLWVWRTNVKEKEVLSIKEIVVQIRENERL